jgi:hypothetical protein
MNPEVMKLLMEPLPEFKSLPRPLTKYLPKEILNNDGIKTWWKKQEFVGFTYTVKQDAFDLYQPKRLIAALGPVTPRINKPNVRYCVGSHMKFYLAVKGKKEVATEALITSANLCGLSLNEIGIVTKDEDVVRQLHFYFNYCWNKLK